MVKCPKCNKEIESLNNYASGETKYTFDGDNYEQDGDFQADNKVNDYECPECSEVLFTDEDEAISFLKGEDELQRTMKEKLKQIKEKKK